MWSVRIKQTSVGPRQIGPRGFAAGCDTSLALQTGSWMDTFFSATSRGSPAVLLALSLRLWQICVVDYSKYSDSNHRTEARMTQLQVAFLNYTSSPRDPMFYDVLLAWSQYFYQIMSASCHQGALFWIGGGGEDDAQTLQKWEGETVMRQAGLGTPWPPDTLWHLSGTTLVWSHLERACVRACVCMCVFWRRVFWFLDGHVWSRRLVCFHLYFTHVKTLVDWLFHPALFCTILLF